MKLVMVFVPSECLEQVRATVEEHAVHAFSEIPSVTGAGRSGRKLGTRAFPGTSSMLLAVLDAEGAERLVTAVRECAGASPCAEGIRAFTVPAEAVV